MIQTRKQLICASLAIAAGAAVFGAIAAGDANSSMLLPSSRWELLILDGDPPGPRDPRPIGVDADSKGLNMFSLGIGDLDGDGKPELIIGSQAGTPKGQVGNLFWYRPATYERGIIDTGNFGVGIAVDDMDGDGLADVVVGRRAGTTEICWYRGGRNLNAPLERHTIDAGPADWHDLVMADLDGDGNKDLVSNGMVAYRRPSDPTKPWPRQEIGPRVFAEGTSIGDLDGDGRPDVVLGPYWFSSPAGGPFSGPWKKHDLAPAMRNMCRTAVVDVNGDRRPDVVVVESEYPDGRLSWFENRRGSGGEPRWIEHRIDGPLNFAHSLYTWRDAQGLHVFTAEMQQGGWHAPVNWEARLLRYDVAGGGERWQRKILYRGAGTHEATLYDFDGDGALEVVGKVCWRAKVQIWKQRPRPSPILSYRHRLLDRDKPNTCTDMLAADVDGDRRPDAICGSWWYRNPGWERYEIPGIYQVLNAYDLDGDGRKELIAMKPKAGASDWYGKLSGDVCWVKAVDPLRGRWEEHPIGSMAGDWPHGTVIAPLLPGNRLALVALSHRAGPGELFEAPSPLTAGPWRRTTLSDIPMREQVVSFDLNGDGKLDLITGVHWLENRGDGSFAVHQFAPEDFQTARIAVADIDGNGKADIVMEEMDLSYDTRESYYGRVAWFEPTGDLRGPFNMHVIDKVRAPHSLGIADLDGDGDPELVAGEHDPFQPYRSRSRLYVYKKANRAAQAWHRYVLDDRFEHHCGARIIELAPGRTGILSHGWAESIFVHLWETPAR